MFDYWMVIPLVSTLIVQPEKLPGKNAIKIQLAPGGELCRILYNLCGTACS